MSFFVPIRRLNRGIGIRLWYVKHTIAQKLFRDLRRIVLPRRLCLDEDVLSLHHICHDNQRMFDDAPDTSRDRSTWQKR